LPSERDLQVTDYVFNSARPAAEGGTPASGHRTNGARIDLGENCQSRHYRYEVDEKLGCLRKQPLHDQYSHAADAFRTAAVMIREPEKKKEQGKRRPDLGCPRGAS
jgi:hypothetical protein